MFEDGYLNESFGMIFFFLNKERLAENELGCRVFKLILKCCSFFFRKKKH